jgi:hypothetical protein
VHDIAYLVALRGDNVSLPLAQIHQHWYFQRIDGPKLLLPPPRLGHEPAILPPLKVVTRGRPRRDQNRSTLRDPSQFEQGIRGGRRSNRGRGRQQQATQVTVNVNISSPGSQGERSRECSVSSGGGSRRITTIIISDEEEAEDNIL